MGYHARYNKALERLHHCLDRRAYISSALITLQGGLFMCAKFYLMNDDTILRQAIASTSNFIVAAPLSSRIALYNKRGQDSFRRQPCYGTDLSETRHQWYIGVTTNKNLLFRKEWKVAMITYQSWVSMASIIVRLLLNMTRALFLCKDSLG